MEEAIVVSSSSSSPSTSMAVELWQTLEDSVTALSGNFFLHYVVSEFLVHQIVLITRDFEEQMQPPFQPGEISEEELEQYDSKKMAIKGQIYHISQSRWSELRGKRRMEFRY
ncbi:hypothetical protein H5410_016742 [Solanum commersonii]|uniref:Uncharacterized protein n=1 Tax=Solanum commersonii TaxID=4109 RepID=A0A9J5ZX68_SOLCO|nr:hypothetical protein H5410_016742 [Solanum commersonii]